MTSARPRAISMSFTGLVIHSARFASSVPRETLENRWFARDGGRKPDKCVACVLYELLDDHHVLTDHCGCCCAAVEEGRGGEVAEGGVDIGSHPDG